VTSDDCGSGDPLSDRCACRPGRLHLLDRKLRSSCLWTTKKNARGGARHRIAPGSARGTVIGSRLRGRGGGRYIRGNLAAVHPCACCGRLRGHDWGHSIVPRAEPGAMLCRAPSRADAVCRKVATLFHAVFCVDAQGL